MKREQFNGWDMVGIFLGGLLPGLVVGFVLCQPFWGQS